MLVERFRWGLVPRWSKQPSTRYTTVTARMERASKSRIFGKPWKSQHCVIPLSGYYKWDRSSRPHTPYFIHARDGAALLAAGLWELWEHEGDRLHSFSVLTHPNPAIPPPLTADGPIFLSEHSWTHVARACLLSRCVPALAVQPDLASYGCPTPIAIAAATTTPCWSHAASPITWNRPMPVATKKTTTMPN